MPAGSHVTTVPLVLAILLAACARPPPTLPPPVAPASVPLVVESLNTAAPAPTPIAAPIPPVAVEADPEPPSEPEAGPTVPARLYLAPGVATRPLRRAVLARTGPLSFAPGGARLGDAQPARLTSRIEGIVVEEHPRSLRLVIEYDLVRIVVFVPRAALHVVSTRAAWLAVAPDRAPDPAAGARIAPGVVFDEIAGPGPLHHVRGEASRIGFEGWLAADAVGVSFVPGGFAAAGRGGLVAESTAIVNAAGEILARVPPPRVKDASPAFSFDVTPVPGAPAGFQAIHLELPDLEVNGLVPSASYQPRPPSATMSCATGSSSGAGGFITDTEHALIRKGAELLDDKGEPVGVALAEVEVFMSFVRDADKSPLRPARVLLWPFGFCEFQIRRADVRPLRR